ncbi:MAG: hypothetical protein M3547_00505 [Acidobacteriota bacterium]|nr:hypothetical protein [Acidobacteriota bacterium]
MTVTLTQPELAALWGLMGLLVEDRLLGSQRIVHLLTDGYVQEQGDIPPAQIGGSASACRKVFDALSSFDAEAPLGPRRLSNLGREGRNSDEG